MTVEDILKLANAKLEMDDLLEAKRILTDGYEKYNDTQLLDMLRKVQSATKHLESFDLYKEYYEISQSRGDNANILKLLERKMRSWTGKRTRKLLRTIPEENRFIHNEREIIDGGYLNILDVGCQIGKYTISLGGRNQNLNIVGVDISSYNISEAKELNRYKNVSFIQGFAEKTHHAFKPDSFDFVMLFEILEHVISVEAVLDSVLKVLKENGKVAITVPFGLTFDEHVRFFSDERITKLFGNMKEFKYEKLFLSPGDEKYAPGCGWNYITFLK